MRRLLLDTHAYIWALTDPDRLTPEAGAALRDPGSRLLVSAASVWEIALKHRIGRWPEADRLLVDHGRLCERLGAEHLPVDWHHARRAGALRWEHADPFDRMLAAQAISEDAELVTREPAFSDLTGLSVLW